MKILCLNTWGGRTRNSLKDFFKQHEDVDIFCLQEVYRNAEGKEKNPDYQNDLLDLFHDVSKILVGHDGFFGEQVGDYYGLAIFYKKGLTKIKEDNFLVHKKEDRTEDLMISHDRTIQYVTVELENKKLTIINFHGLWTGKGKEDTDDRIKQSEKIISFLKTLDHPYILCGDFNLLPDTESIKMLEGVGLRNLIKEHGITSTRTSLYTKPDKFADYAFVSPGIEVVSFKVLPDEVSDHSPLEIEIK